VTGAQGPQKRKTIVAGVMSISPGNPQSGVADSADHGREEIFSLKATMIASPTADSAGTVAPQIGQGIVAQMTVIPGDAQKLKFLEMSDLDRTTLFFLSLCVHC